MTCKFQCLKDLGFEVKKMSNIDVHIYDVELLGLVIDGDIIIGTLRKNDQSLFFLYTSKTMQLHLRANKYEYIITNYCSPRLIEFSPFIRYIIHSILMDSPYRDKVIKFFHDHNRKF